MSIIVMGDQAAGNVWFPYAKQCMHKLLHTYRLKKVQVGIAAKSPVNHDIVGKPMMVSAADKRVENLTKWYFPKEGVKVFVRLVAGQPQAWIYTEGGVYCTYPNNTSPVNNNPIHFGFEDRWVCKNKASTPYALDHLQVNYKLDTLLAGGRYWVDTAYKIALSFCPFTISGQKRTGVFHKGSCFLAVVDDTATVQAATKTSGGEFVLITNRTSGGNMVIEALVYPNSSYTIGKIEKTEGSDGTLIVTTLTPQVSSIRTIQLPYSGVTALTNFCFAGNGRTLAVAGYLTGLVQVSDPADLFITLAQKLLVYVFDVGFTTFTTATVDFPNTYPYFYATLGYFAPMGGKFIAHIVTSDTVFGELELVPGSDGDKWRTRIVTSHEVTYSIETVDTDGVPLTTLTPVVKDSRVGRVGTVDSYPTVEQFSGSDRGIVAYTPNLCVWYEQTYVNGVVSTVNINASATGGEITELFHDVAPRYAIWISSAYDGKTLLIVDHMIPVSLVIDDAYAKINKKLHYEKLDTALPDPLSVTQIK